MIESSFSISNGQRSGGANRFFCRVVLLVLLAYPVTFGQDRSNTTTSGVLNPENGTIINNLYRNEILGFSYPMPEGWYVSLDDNHGSQVTGKYLQGGGLLLLMADQHTGGPFRNRLLIIADSATKYHGLSVEAYVDKVVRAQTNKLGMQLIRDVFAVDLAGRHFYRADYDENFGGGATRKTFICTELNGYLLSWTFVTGSEEDLEAAVSSLQRISFWQPEVSPNSNVMPSAATIPPVPDKRASEKPMSERPRRIRISQSVAQSYLAEKVQPTYPEEGRRNHIQGNVVMKAVITQTGEVKELTVISGDPALVPAAVEAVKQWRYRPYKLNGEAIEVETQVTVAFQLVDH